MATYFNTYQQREMEWDPETGGSYIPLLKVPVKDADTGNIVKHMAEFASPQQTHDQGLAQLALYMARHPDWPTPRLIHAPCMFSRSDCWIDLPPTPSAEIMADAEETASHCHGFGTDHLHLDAYKRRHGLSTSYM